MKIKSLYLFLFSWFVSIAVLLTDYRNYVSISFVPFFIYFGLKQLELTNDFSYSIKKYYPEIFQKVKMNYGYYKDEWIHSYEINDANFINIEGESKKNYSSLKQNFIFLILTFISFGVSSVLIVLFE